MTGFEVATRAYENAIKLSPGYAQAYQGLYLLQAREGYRLDAVNTIKLFFYRNKPVRSESSIKGFLVDWIDLLKAVSDFGDTSHDILMVQSAPMLLQEWRELSSTLAYYADYFRYGTLLVNINLRSAQELAASIVNDSSIATTGR